MRNYKGKRVVVSAGPTREYIDAVRFISNPSSGKMGYAIANAAAKRGAEVVLVSGPVCISAHRKINVVSVMSASDMDRAVSEAFKTADVLIMAAAVSDYTPKEKIAKKMKKAGDMTLELIRTTDILEKLGKAKKNQIVVGFAAETNDGIAYATDKLKRKNLDMIVLNDVSRKDAGFNKETNHVILIKRDKSKKELPTDTKVHIAEKILDEILTLKQ